MAPIDYIYPRWLLESDVKRPGDDECHLLSRQPFYLKEAQNTERRVYGMKPLQEIMTGELTDIDNQLKPTNKLLNSTNHLETNTIEPSKSGTRLEEGKEKKGTQQVHLIR
ncbi:hypothetical protein F442_18503 [Phytophthora nicotianae P10297]|uniref:Uncharacterized protein n=1 Tax=Phytophthora nicotianae P10297 TaxID=1317064 RepID=W2YDN4_PHYNI|nr:hypothetical protein F442_18503 [Phytophthora nicotianae P10297]